MCNGFNGHNKFNRKDNAMIHTGNISIQCKVRIHAAIIGASKIGLVFPIMLCSRRIYQIQKQKITAESNKFDKVSTAPVCFDTF